MSIHSLPHLLTACKVAKFTIAQMSVSKRSILYKSHPPAQPFGLSAVECNCKNNNNFWNTCANLRLFLFFCRKRCQTHQNAEVKPEESCQQDDKWQHQICSRKKVFSRKKSQSIILQLKYWIISLIFNTLAKWDFSKKWREKYHQNRAWCQKNMPKCV